MTSTLDVDLFDTDLSDEIQLLAELIVVATESEDSLDAGTIDLLLGVRASRHAVDVPRQRLAS